MAYNNIIDRSGSVAMMPEEVAYNLIKDLNNESVVLSAFTQIPVTRGQVRMPVLSALPMAYFVGADTGLKQTTQQDYVKLVRSAATRCSKLAICWKLRVSVATA